MKNILMPLLTFPKRERRRLIISFLPLQAPCAMSVFSASRRSSNSSMAVLASTTCVSISRLAFTMRSPKLYLYILGKLRCMLITLSARLNKSLYIGNSCDNAISFLFRPPQGAVSGNRGRCFRVRPRYAPCPPRGELFNMLFCSQFKHQYLLSTHTLFTHFSFLASFWGLTPLKG